LAAGESRRRDDVGRNFRSAPINERLRFSIGLGLVSTGAATFAVVFRRSLTLVYQSVFGATNVVDAIAGLPPWMRLLVPIAGAGIAGSIARLRAAPTQGVSNVMEAVALGRVQLSLRTTLSRVASSWASIASGMSIGREGPLIEFGGTVGAAAARRLDVSLNSTRVLVAAGTAAGFAAAYNTPFAGALFVLETIAGIAAPEILLPVMASTVVATVITRLLVGAGPIYGQRAFGLESYGELLSFAGLGAAAAFVSSAFKRTLQGFENIFERQPLPQPFRAMLGGLLVGTLATWLPQVVGNGYEPLNAMLDAQVVPVAVGVLLIAKVIATSGSVASGVPGGIFTPMLLVGASLGTLWAHASGVLMSASPSAGGYALVGMAAATAASIHAPLTAAVMIFELSGDYFIVLPLLVATVVSTSLSRLMGSESIYEAELRRRGLAWDLTLEGRRIKDPAEHES
jgi:CIC family chloride channel protein